MNSIVDVSDSSQSPRGPRTPWSPVRVNRLHGGLSSVAPPNSDPSSFHAVLADTSSRVDVTEICTVFLADRTAKRSVIGYWHDIVLCLSVRLSVTKCFVAKQYPLQQKCLKK